METSLCLSAATSSEGEEILSSLLSVDDTQSILSAATSCSSEWPPESQDKCLVLPKKRARGE